MYNTLLGSPPSTCAQRSGGSRDLQAGAALGPLRGELVREEDQALALADTGRAFDLLPAPFNGAIYCGAP